MFGTLLGVRMSFRVAGARDCAPWWGFCSISKNNGRRGAFEEDLERCISRGRRNTRDMFNRDVKRSGRWFPLHFGASDLQFWEHAFARQVQHFRMTWHHFFVAGAALYIDGMEKSQNALARGRQLCAQLFHFWRTSHRIALFLMLSTSKIEEISQNCFVFDAVNLKNWETLAELLRFWCCQVQKPRKSRRIASFSNLEIDR